jgi:hypothetical protein
MSRLVLELEHVEMLQVGPRKAGLAPELEGICIAPKTAQKPPSFLISEWCEPATSLCLIDSNESAPSGACQANIE